MPKTTKNKNPLQPYEDLGLRLGLIRAALMTVIKGASEFTALASQHPEDLKHRHVVEDLAMVMTNANVSYLLTCIRQIEENGHRAKVEQILEPLASKVPELQPKSVKSH